ncbi:MAG: hypothetical protein KF729_38060 [Sandaracinaceae bacterium]|nr:hypothetical protein [Sandaracinaceae bacterium]
MHKTLPCVLGALALVACAETHRMDADGGPFADAGPCGLAPPPFGCVTACGSDGLVPPVCLGGVWQCGAGTIDPTTCAPGCPGPARPNCVCVGSSWRCEEPICPDGINPWDPMDPASVCRVEGATCTGGSTDSCGPGLFCTCTSGRWDCAVAHPDPACWCEREPSVGSRCNGSVPTCGQCCPTADGPNWPALECVDGVWQPAACPEIVCPPVYEECPVVTGAAVGRACPIEGQSCGDACCGTAIFCDAGRWNRGPEADCACHPGVRCGAGECRAGQYCREQCGPDDGIEHRCVALPADCTSCACLPLEPWQRCEMVGGVPHVQPTGCG